MKAFGIIMSVLLIIFGAVFPVPEKEIRVWDHIYDESWLYKYGREYWGSDSYTIEASLKAGWMSGVLTMKSICVASGILLFFIIIYSDKKHRELEKQTKLLEQITGNSEIPKQEQVPRKHLAEQNLPKQPW